MSDFETSSRKLARGCGRVGFVAFSRAFNATSEPETEWRYGSEVLERFEQLCAELLHLVDTGEIEVNPAHAAWTVAQEARKNEALQTLIQRASKRTPIRAKRA